MTETADLIGARTAASILGVSVRRFNRMVVRGAVTADVTLGDNTAPRLFHRSKIEALAAKQVAA